MDTKKYKDCLVIVDRCRAATDSKTQTEIWAELANYCKQNFPSLDLEKTNDYIAELKPLYSKQGKNKIVTIDYLREIPPKFSDELYFVTLTYLLMYFYNLGIDPGKSLDEFDWFHKTYSQLIIESVCQTLGYKS